MQMLPYETLNSLMSMKMTAMLWPSQSPDCTWTPVGDYGAVRQSTIIHTEGLKLLCGHVILGFILIWHPSLPATE